MKHKISKYWRNELNGRSNDELFQIFRNWDEDKDYDMLFACAELIKERYLAGGVFTKADPIELSHIVGEDSESESEEHEETDYGLAWDADTGNI